MEICCGGDAEGAEDVDDVGNGVVTVGAVDGAIWDSSISST